MACLQRLLLFFDHQHVMPEQQRLGGPQHGQMRHASQQQQEYRLNVISPPNALAIPELLEMVGRCLDRHSLTMCLRVCHIWYQVLRSQVWEMIEKYLGGLPRDSKKSSGPSLPLLSRHSDLIRKLFLKIHRGQIGFPGQPPLYCPCLTELTVIGRGPHGLYTPNRLFEEKLAPFIVEHRRTLKKLVLGVNLSKALTEAMIACSNLESLMIRALFSGGVEELDEWRRWYDSLGSRLRKLTLIWDSSSSVITDDEFIMDKSMDALLSQTSTVSLQNLELRSKGATLAILQFQMLLVMKSPELRHLSWSVINSKATMSRLAEAFEKSSHGLFCQRLESFKLPNHGDFTLEEFQRVMRSLPALKDLDLTGNVPYLPRSIPSYMTTLSTLRTLKIDGCGWATPSVVQDILCSMPNLEVFAADILSDTAIQEDPRPWVCTGLRELTFSFIVQLWFTFPVDGTTEAMMLNRLCQLDRLQTLKFLSDPRVLSHSGLWINPFQFRMDRGLDKLRTLRQLRSFQVPLGQLWSEAEAQWALKNWIQLEEVDIRMDSKAKALLSDKLIKPIEDDFKF